VAESGVIAAEMEEVVDLIMGCREEALGLAGGFELLHLSLPVRASAGPNSQLGCLIPCAGDVQCGLTSLFPVWLASLSVIMTRGGRICFFSSLRISHLVLLRQ
jgi:hypothetical protein